MHSGRTLSCGKQLDNLQTERFGKEEGGTGSNVERITSSLAWTFWRFSSVIPRNCIIHQSPFTAYLLAAPSNYPQKGATSDPSSHARAELNACHKLGSLKQGVSEVLKEAQSCAHQQPDNGT
jgi:hypothetical protein